MSASIIYFAVGDIAAHEGGVTSVVADSDWTYQRDVTHGRESVLYEGPSEDEALRALREWLAPDIAADGSRSCANERCYPHGTRGWFREAGAQS